MTTRSRCLAALAALATVLTMTMTMTTPSAHAAPAGRYVAVGDSYASVGSLTALPVDPAGFACQRSADAYPSLVAQRIGMPLTNATCGGATTGSYWGETQFGPVIVPPQREAVTADTDLVTVQLGGNPALPSKVFPACAPTAVGAPTPCRAAVDGVAYAGTAAQLGEIVRDVKARAPRARVVLVGYLQPVPDAAVAASPVACPTLAGMSVDDRRAVHDFVARLNANAAAVAEAEGVAYAEAPGDGLGVCAARGQREVSALGWAGAEDAAPGHPTAAGHVAVADAVAAAAG